MAGPREQAPLPPGLAAWLDDAAHGLDTAADDATAVLPRLGDAGLFRIGVPVALGGSGGDVTDAVRAVAAVSERSLAAGFVFWGQRTFIEYLLQSPNEGLRARLLPALLEGRRAGATGLSNAMKFLAGFEELQLKASAADRALRIDGKLPWVTNLQPTGFDVAAAVEGAGDDPAFIVSLSSDDDGVSRSADLDLMALRATSTAAIKIDDARVGAERILHPDAHAWLPKVRPAFLGLQCGMSIGLARSALTETEAKLRSGRDVLAEPFAAISAELADLHARLARGLAAAVFETEPSLLFRLRIRLAEVVAEAVQLELCASGGAAYLTQPGAGIQRRLRESAFVPVVTPSLVQLKTALAAHPRVAAVGAVA
ncbi:MAG: acyl-CoA/acyl-ACP dehydrogenase [Xanthobacteraceae bacterium]|nr:acyl-CoA/acyl-ACP dehydrogenase [Xanthobacteraceae bacterium]